MAKYFLCFLGLIFAAQMRGQIRVKQSINSNWEFHQGDIAGYPADRSAKAEWKPVTLPHSWNTTDVTDDMPGYYRGASWYKRALYLPPTAQDKQLYLYFEGADQVTEVYVNGHLAGKHIGGYTGFSILIQPYLNPAKDSLTKNDLLIKVDNSHNENIPPLSADFTFFGGLYRDVYLVTADKVHFTMDDHGSNGIKINTPSVSADKADVLVSGMVSNQSSASKNLLVVTEISDAQGKMVSKAQSSLQLKAGTDAFFSQAQQVKSPHLWSPDEPYLYRAITRIYDRNNVLLDELSNPVGFRWFSFDADKGFFLNGKSLKLVGASRHQDYKGMANALPNAMHEHDMEILKNIGGNFVRIAHYPQDPAVLEACDRLGVLASVEIPIVNAITESNAFADNCKEMQVEMIRQNYNHPSVIIWAYMNEVLLKPKYQKGSDQQNKYFAAIASLAKQLDSIARAEDKQRYTMIPCHGDFNLYQRVGLTAIPQIVGWNLYQGWYSAGLEGFSKFLDHHHQELPHTPLIVTEYGADADIRIHSSAPERFDKSIEYQLIYHQYYLQSMQERPFVAGAAIWNLSDFNSESRADASPHINTKGLNTIDRQPKDAFLFYQANLLQKPFLKIGSTGWKLRTGIADDNQTCTQSLSVFSNGKQVELQLNGKALGSKELKGGVALFDVPFVDGVNTLKAVSIINGKTCEDIAEIEFKLTPALFTDKAMSYPELNISLGDRRYLVDEKLHQVWMPEQAYKKGSWGYIGGKVFGINPGRQGFGSDKDIFGTDLDAVYQTQRLGIDAFKFDVADGEYDITLGFAELESKSNAPALIYNLGNNAQTTDGSKQRSFDVSINGQLIIKSLGTQNYLLPQREYTTTIRVSVKNNIGITVDFKALQGESILNAIQLKRVF